MTEKEVRNKLLTILDQDPDSIKNYALKIDIDPKIMSTFLLYSEKTSPRILKKIEEWINNYELS